MKKEYLAGSCARRWSNAAKKYDIRMNFYLDSLRHDSPSLSMISYSRYSASHYYSHAFQFGNGFLVTFS